MKKSAPKPLKQVAALAIRKDPIDGLRVMLMTSRQTRRMIVPKGWRMKGLPDYRAAEVEAAEEAGVAGRISKKIFGSYEYWKRLDGHFALTRVKVYLLEVERELPVWKEQGQRYIGWFKIDDAAYLVDEPQLASVILKLKKRKAG